MKYLKQTYERLIRGTFISRDSVSKEIRTIFKDIDDHRTDYRDYFSKIGLTLEEGDGYFYLSRTEARANLSDKLVRFSHWIDVLDFIKAWEPAFVPGFQFTKSALLLKIDADIELKDKIKSLYADKEKHSEIVNKLIDEMTRYGFVELAEEMSEKYETTNAFLYLEELVGMLTIEDPEDETSK